MPDVFDRVELTGARVWWLLELHFAGQVFRCSSGDLEVDSTDLGTLHYVDALGAIDYETTLALFDAPGEVSIPLELILPGVDVAALVQAGHDLGAATAELSRWLPGTTYEDRQVVLSGIVTEPTYGATNEPIAFSLATSPYEDRSIVPDAAAVVSATTWPNAAPGAIGRVYPLVFGRPGLLSNGALCCGSPALVVDADAHTLLLAGHEVAATVVHIIDGADPTTAHTATVTTSTDALGRRVAVCTVPTGMGLFTFDANASYYVAWGLASTGGGLKNRRGDGTLEQAGDVLEYFLDRTTLSVDPGRLQAARGLLQGFVLAGYIDELCNVWEWLTANLVPLLPVSVLPGPDGLVPLVWRYDARREDAILHVDVDALDAERVGPVEYGGIAGGKLCNELALSYAIQADSGGYKRVATCTGDSSHSRVAGRFTTYAARISRSRYGAASVAESTDLVYDETTAGRIAAWKVQSRSLPTRTFTYLFDVRAISLALGDLVTLSDSELSLDHELCMVVDLGDQDDGLLQVKLRTCGVPLPTKATPAPAIPVTLPTLAGYGTALVSATPASGKVVSGPYTNEPVWIDITNPQLRTVANGGAVTSSSGYDVAWTDENGVQLDLWGPTIYDGSAGRWAGWARVPSLSSSSVLYGFAGNSAITTDQSVDTTWKAEFAERFSGHTYASGGFIYWRNDAAANHGGSGTGALELGGRATENASGPFGPALELDGTALTGSGTAGPGYLWSSNTTYQDAHCPGGTGGSAPPRFPAMLGIWFRLPVGTTGQTGALFFYGNNFTTAERLVLRWGIQDAFAIHIDNGLQFTTGVWDGPGKDYAGSSGLNDGNWHHAALVFASGGSTVADVTLYVDGVPQTPAAPRGNPATRSTSQVIGPTMSPAQNWAGLAAWGGEAFGSITGSSGHPALAEHWVRSDAPTADWLTTFIANNQLNNASFWVFATL